MVDNKKLRYRIPTAPSTPTSFDISQTKKQPAASFPAVGQTLSTYQKSPVKQSPKATSNRFHRLRSLFTRKRIILAIVTLLIISFGWLGWKVIYNTHRLFGGSVLDVLSSTKLDGEDQGRVNILLAGNSADDPGHQGGTLTDSIMIMSIDTKHKSGFMMSIPRDLYVEVPGYGHQKINAVFPAGESSHFSENNYATGGMGLLQKTIEEDFGVHTNYYALVNYNALRDAVNSVGGVDITIQSSDPRGLYDPSRDYSAPKAILVKLSNGAHHLNGQQALNLARARGDARGSYGFGNADFTRTANQRQLILALRSKATSAGVLANPIKLGKLFDSLGSNVQTNLKLNDVKRLYEVTKGINGTNIQSIGLNDVDGMNLLQNYRTSRGESALVPAAGLDDYSDIQSYIQRITSDNLVVREDATIVLLNGTSKVGLAARESDILEQQNLQVASVNDADREDYATTQIIDLSSGKKPASLAAIKKAYAGSTVTTTNPYGTTYKADFIVVLGNDRLSSTTSTGQ